MSGQILFEGRNAAAAVGASSEAYAILEQRGSFTLGYYMPYPADEQHPHDEDELYIVAAGSGTFVVDGEPLSFAPGDALLAPAGSHHRFVDFSEDLALWFVFWGASAD